MRPRAGLDSGMLSRSAILLALLGPLATAPAQEPEFTVDFNGPGQPIARGLLYGMNDLTNASAGVWKAWAESVNARDGVVRIWLKYNFGQLNESHFRAGEMAKEAGMGIMLTITGKPGSRVDPRQGGVQEVPDPQVMADQAAADVAKLLARGLPIRYVELWNEPDMPNQWGGTDEEFAQFWAKACSILRPKLDARVKLGGPGMAACFGGGLRTFRLMAAACQQQGYKPDFLSWHDYSSFPMDQYYHNTARLVTKIAADHGLGAPELILSEWNAGLPGKSRPYHGADDHHASANFVGMTTALAATPVTHSLFFMLQDGVWETSQDFAGESVGVFTVHGAPKSVLAAMRMMSTAASLPRVPVTPRNELTVNFSLLATREGNRGYLVAASCFGKTDEHARKMVEAAGVDLTTLNKKEELLQRFARGDVSYEATGLPAKDRPIWERTAREMQALAKEQRDQGRRITVRLKGAPVKVIGAWVIDEQHGNPVADADFRKRFAPHEGGWFPVASQLTMQQLRAEGVPDEELKRIEAAFRAKKAENMAGVAPAHAARAKAIFAEMQARAEHDTPRELARHPAAAPAKVPVQDWAQLQGDLLSLRLPPFTSLMLEVSWDPKATEDEQ